MGVAKLTQKRIYVHIFFSYKYTKKKYKFIVI
jgi:hypothetical protein